MRAPSRSLAHIAAPLCSSRVREAKQHLKDRTRDCAVGFMDADRHSAVNGGALVARAVYPNAKHRMGSKQSVLWRRATVRPWPQRAAIGAGDAFDRDKNGQLLWELPEVDCVDRRGHSNVGTRAESEGAPVVGPIGREGCLE
eukprot:1634947-Prymnesium_polylepis.2